MGIFNEQSFDHPFARGIQGAPGVGFNLTVTADGNYDMINRKLRNVGAPASNTDAATKKYVDDNSGGGKTSLITVDSNIDMKDSFRILNLKSPSDTDEPATKKYADSHFFDKSGSHPMTGNVNMNNNRMINLPSPNAGDQPATKLYTYTNFLNVDGTTPMPGDFNIAGHKILNLRTPTTNSEPATKNYVDNNFLDLDVTEKMTGNLDMNNNQINNIPAPTGNNPPTPLGFTDLKYLHVAGTNKMTYNLNMDNKNIINLRIPTAPTDAATKKYVDDNTAAPDLSDYLEKDGTVAMTGDLNAGNNKIKNLSNPTQDNEAVTKDYADKLVHHTAVQPSHYKDELSYLMSSSIQWTDEIDGGNSFNITKIDNLLPSQGNFHDYNHKVLYTTIIKNSQGGYKYNMGINFYRLPANINYTLCLTMIINCGINPR